ncbi:MAG: hypothetical protein RLZZ15_2092 [Verrucomicrobiota bacterium]|jgi:hypothetical protein
MMTGNMVRCGTGKRARIDCFARLGIRRLAHNGCAIVPAWERGAKGEPWAAGASGRARVAV